MAWIYPVLMASIVILILHAGDRDAKIAILAITAAAISTYFSYVLVGRTWLIFNSINILIEGTLLLILLRIAMHSRNYWPLLVTAFQIMGFLANFAILFGKDLVSYGLGVTQSAWGDLQLLTLAIVTIRKIRIEKMRR